MRRHPMLAAIGAKGLRFMPTRVGTGSSVLSANPTRGGAAARVGQGTRRAGEGTSGHNLLEGMQVLTP